MRTACFVAVWVVLGIGRAGADKAEVQEIPLDLVFSGACPGHEDIAVTGTEYMVFRQRSDNHGGVHISFRFGFRGDASGIGLTTGTQYRLVGSGGGSEFYGNPLPVVITRQVRFSFVGPGPDNNIQAFETANIKINANGEVTVSIADASFECRD
jgi:hypothetical protein